MWLSRRVAALRCGWVKSLPSLQRFSCETIYNLHVFFFLKGAWLQPVEKRKWGLLWWMCWQRVKNGKRVVCLYVITNTWVRWIAVFSFKKNVRWKCMPRLSFIYALSGFFWWKWNCLFFQKQPSCQRSTIDRTNIFVSI